MLASLGAIHARLGQYPVALGEVEQALALFRKAGDRLGEARVRVTYGGLLHEYEHAA